MTAIIVIVVVVILVGWFPCIIHWLKCVITARMRLQTSMFS